MPTACVCSIDDIKKNCLKNVAGMASSVHVACLDDIAANPVPTTGTYIVPSLTMATGKVFHTWEPDSKDYTYEDKPTDGDMRDITFSFFIPRMDSEKTFILDNLTDENQIVVLHDNNGNKVIVGDKTHGATITYEATATPKNGYKVTGKCMMTHSPYYLTGAVTV